MHRRLPALKHAILTLCLCSFWLAPVLAQETPQAPMDLQLPESQGMTVPFNHNEHNKKAKITKCVTCHHALPGMTRPGKKGAPQKNLTERKCSDCHRARPTANDLAPSLMLASHKQCQDCHMAKKRGPVECSGCHKTEVK